MGISRSFNIGISGLSAMGKGLGVISDNIANAGTNGFKASRAEFQDLLSTSLKGFDGSNQIGTGVKLGHVKLLMGQGDIARTESSTDLAISGDGFFRVQTPFGDAFTRDGSMHFNKDGNLVSADGYEVLGFQSNAKGKITTKLKPIKIKSQTIPAKATEEVKIDMNFDSRADILAFNPERPDDSANFSHAVTIYDNVGTARVITLYYNKEANNTWTYRAMVDGKDVEGGNPEKMVAMAKGTITFNNKGVLQDVKQTESSFNFNKGAAPGQSIKFNFGKSIVEGGDGLGASTQFGSKTIVSRHSSDGHSAAPIGSFSFNSEGILRAIYANGESRDIAQVAIAAFESNEGLFKLGKNLYRSTRNSGRPIMGRPGESGRGEIIAKSIELANVDIADEFVSLMTSQRNFQANAKTLQTADEMLQEVLSLKR